VFVTSSGGVVAQRCFFATPQAAYANTLRSANFYIHNLTHYAQCPTGSLRSGLRPTAHKEDYAKVGWQCPPTRVAKRGSVMSLRGLFVPRSGKCHSYAQAHKSASGSPPAQDTHRHSLLLLQSSAAYAQARRSPTLCLFVAIATALLSGLRRTRGSATNRHSYGGFGLGFSVTSLPQCRRGAFPASISAVRRLPQGRYAVGCAAARQEKEKRFCKCFCRLFFKQL